jgi:hypothetical protein
MPIFKQPTVELTADDYQGMMAQAAKQTQDLENLLGEYLLYKKDADGQLSVQWTNIDECKAALAALRKDHESWRAQFIDDNKKHDGRFTQLANTLDNTAKSLQIAINGVSARVDATNQANVRQDVRLDQLDSSIKDLASKNNRQDADLNTAVQSMAVMADALSALTKRVLKLEQPIEPPPPPQEDQTI